MLSGVQLHPKCCSSFCRQGNPAYEDLIISLVNIDYIPVIFALDPEMISFEEPQHKKDESNAQDPETESMVINMFQILLKYAVDTNNRVKYVASLNS